MIDCRYPSMGSLVFFFIMASWVSEANYRYDLLGFSPRQSIFVRRGLDQCMPFVVRLDVTSEPGAFCHHVLSPSLQKFIELFPKKCCPREEVVVISLVPMANPLI